MENKYSVKAFLAILRAGLWADVDSTDFLNHGIKETVDWDEVYRLAVEQSVVGFVASGL